MASQDAITFLPPDGYLPEFPPPVRRRLHTIEESVGRGASLELAMELVWRETEGLIPRDRISIAFVNDAGTAAVSHYVRADYDEFKIGEGYGGKLAGSSLERILDSGATRIIHDLEAYREEHPDSRPTADLFAEGVRGNITLPLVVEERRVGFLFFSDREPGTYTAEHGLMLQSILERLAQAIEKAWLIRILRRANQDYLTRLGFVAHELKSPLGAIITQGLLYQDGYLGAVEEPAAGVIRKMIQGAQYLLDMVGNYLGLARLESGEIRYTPQDGVRLSELVDFATTTVSVHARQKGTELVFDLPEREILLRGDPGLLQTVLINLLDNGIKYGVDAGKVTLAARVEGETLTLSVHNLGVGFTEEQKSKLFQRFSRLRQKGTERARGTGLGLYLVWWILETHGGTITAESEPGAWARFTLTLPGATLGEAVEKAG